MAVNGPDCRVWRLWRQEFEAHLNVVVPVVVEIEDAVELALLGHVNVLGVLQTLADRLPRVLLHLDVVELPASKHRM
jgi:hypothetical protein